MKGAPDVVVERCGRALWHGEQVPIATVRDEILAANRQLSERGLRVLAFAARDLDDAAMSAAMADPMAAVTDLDLRRAGRDHGSAAHRGQGRRAQSPSRPGSTSG